MGDFDLVQDVRDLTLADLGLATYLQAVGLRSTATLAAASRISGLFWL